MIPVPYQKYVEALIVGRTDEPHTLDNLRKLQLTIPQVNYKQVYNYVYKILPDYLDDDEEQADIKALEDLQIADMVCHLFPIHINRAPIGAEGALRILNDPQMRRLMTCLALASITSEEMELIINNKFAGNSYTSEDIESFLHYFFNLTAFTYHDKREYVELIADPGLKSFYKIALTGDKDYLVWKLGVAPEKSYETMLREMMLDSFYLFKEQQRHQPDTAARWGQLAVKISDKLDKITKETQNQVNELEDFEFQTFATADDDDTPPEEEIKPMWDLADDTDK